MAEDHLQNILKLIAYDDYDEVIMGRLIVYVKSRGLLPNEWPGVGPYDVEEINELLKTLPDIAIPED